ncbi:ATP-binding cassette domain-containing protein [Rhodococcus triatomae]|nr:ATP-binding cassette domain-containing protein [Rhodococcus triatomae]QNG21207.1 ATP-binding cassette domain-containing protein [Rhodococcus triatomae]QNG25503.1 ATP-binding cassette domain-containing protein [Rhodococcus triatomae]
MTVPAGNSAPGAAAPIEVRELTKVYKTVPAVTDVSFTVPRGSVTGFLGPNGSGKTTTLRMILGLAAPTSGVATIEGVPFASLPHPGRTVGAVLDAGTLHPKRTAIDHLRVYAPAVGVPDHRAEEVLELVGLGAARRRRVGEFSLGMRQRLALATALLGDPHILVLDEPANGLDPEGIAWLRHFLEGFAASGRTVLVSSHILREVEQMVDHLLILSRGSLVYQGRIDDLRRSQHSRLLVASSSPPDLATALAAHGVVDSRSLTDGRLAVVGADATIVEQVAAEAGVTVFGIAVEQIDLEQLFLSMTAAQYVAGATPGAPGGYGPPVPPPYPPGYPGTPGYPPPGYPPPGYPPQHGYPPPGYPPQQGYPPRQGFPPHQGYPPPGYPQQPPTGPGGPR